MLSLSLRSTILLNYFTLESLSEKTVKGGKELHYVFYIREKMLTECGPPKTPPSPHICTNEHQHVLLTEKKKFGSWFVSRFHKTSL